MFSNSMYQNVIKFHYPPMPGEWNIDVLLGVVMVVVVMGMVVLLPQHGRILVTS